MQSRSTVYSSMISQPPQILDIDYQTQPHVSTALEKIIGRKEKQWCRINEALKHEDQTLIEEDKIKQMHAEIQLMWGDGGTIKGKRRYNSTDQNWQKVFE